jgi:RNA polymerase sigma-B factor
VGDDDDGFELIDVALLADSLIATLAERDQTIVRLRFEQELTQQEIGRRIGCSQMQVSRLLRAALARLRSEAYAAGLTPAG